MAPRYETVSRSEQEDYRKFAHASQYLARDFNVDVGSGSDPNAFIAQFTDAASQNMWALAPHSKAVTGLSPKNIDYGKYAVVLLEGLTARNIPVPTVATTKDKLEQIRDAFGLNISDMAKVLGASRPTVGHWLEGEEEPRIKQHIERIERIVRIARNWSTRTIFYYPPARLMKQPLAAGLSMLDRMARVPLDEKEIDEGITMLLELMKKQREQMDQAKQRAARYSLPDSNREDNRHLLTTTISSR